MVRLHLDARKWTKPAAILAKSGAQLAEGMTIGSFRSPALATRENSKRKGRSRDYPERFAVRTAR